MNVYQGMIIWKWRNNLGIIYRFIIPNSYYVPAGKCYLLGPQHWSKSRSGNNTARKDIGNNTTANTTTHLLNHGSNNLDKPLGYHDNVSTFNLDPGYQKFQSFKSVIKRPRMHGQLIVYSTVVGDDEDDKDDNVPPPDKQQRNLWYQLTGLPIRLSQAEEEAWRPCHYLNNTILNRNGPRNSDTLLPMVIEEE